MAASRCQRCDAEIPAGAPEGLCPRCLLQSSETGPYVPRSGFVAPTIEALQAAFPQLEILELLGHGGMGAVYKARQPMLDRFVAVKILPPELGKDSAFVERFLREARALAKLNHPNIVGVHDFGQAAGYCYFVMEYLDGVNLRQAIRTGQLKPAETLKIVPQVCEALQFAHDEGVVHRDIKPENILLDKRGRVKIADFGLAKLLGLSANDLSLTGTRQALGTLRYMAPEQIEGSRDVDHRADIYSLGVTFYEMLTGEVPMGRFAPPSKKVQVDVRLDEVVLRTLEREPELRYQQASDVKTELEAIRNSPSSSPPVPVTHLPTANSRMIGFAIVWCAILVFTLLVVLLDSLPSLWIVLPLVGWTLVMLVQPASAASDAQTPTFQSFLKSQNLTWPVLLLLFIPTVTMFAMYAAFSSSPAVSVDGVALQESVGRVTLAFRHLMYGCLAGAGVLTLWVVVRWLRSSSESSLDRLIRRTADALLIWAFVAALFGVGTLVWELITPDLFEETRINLRMTGAVLLGLAPLIGWTAYQLRTRRGWLLTVLLALTILTPAVFVTILRWNTSWYSYTNNGFIGFWLGAPLAIWTLVLLFLDDVRAAFERTQEKEPELRFQQASEVKSEVELIAGSGAARSAAAGDGSPRPQRWLFLLPLVRVIGLGLAALGVLCLVGPWAEFSVRNSRPGLPALHFFARGYQTTAGMVGGAALLLAFFATLAGLRKRWYAVPAVYGLAGLTALVAAVLFVRAPSVKDHPELAKYIGKVRQFKPPDSVEMFGTGLRLPLPSFGDTSTDEEILRYADQSLGVNLQLTAQSGALFCGLAAFALILLSILDCKLVGQQRAAKS